MEHIVSSCVAANGCDAKLQAHFESGNDERALDLIRLEWGYMLYTNISTQSTFLEGYTTTGGLGYDLVMLTAIPRHSRFSWICSYRANSGYANDVAYTSHAHGWSTGPTSALTFYVTGVTIVEARGRKWRFAPHTSGLSAAQGSFETPLGTFGATWTLGASPPHYKRRRSLMRPVCVQTLQASTRTSQCPIRRSVKSRWLLSKG